MPSPAASPFDVSETERAFDELTFAGDSKPGEVYTLGEKQIEESRGKGEMGEIGEFVRMCKSAPPLKVFSSFSEKRLIGSSFLFADMTTSQMTNQVALFSLADK